MPRGDKSSYSTKQRRQARHIEDSYESRGAATKKAERIAWATVNKKDGGAAGRKASPKSKSKSMAKSAKRSASTSRSKSSASR